MGAVSLRQRRDERSTLRDGPTPDGPDGPPPAIFDCYFERKKKLLIYLVKLRNVSSGRKEKNK